MWFLGIPSNRPTNWRLLAFLVVALFSFNGANALGGWMEEVFGEPQRVVVKVKDREPLQGRGRVRTDGSVQIETGAGQMLIFQQSVVESLTVLHPEVSPSLSWFRWGPVFAWCLAALVGGAWLSRIRSA